MSDTEQETKPVKTNWGVILKDMAILVCVMAGLGYLSKLMMQPFEVSNPADNLNSIIAKGSVNYAMNVDAAFDREMANGKKNDPDFVNLCDHNGRTPLMWAVYANFNGVADQHSKDLERLFYVRALLQEPKIDIKAKDKDGFSALHWACWSGMRYNALQLIAAGVDIHEPENNGYSPLMLAAMRGNADTVAMLLKFGAKDEKGEALKLAESKSEAYKKRHSFVYSLLYADDREAAYAKTVEELKNAPAEAASFEETLAEMQQKLAGEEESFRNRKMDEAAKKAAADAANSHVKKAEAPAEEAPAAEEKPADAPQS